MKYLLTTLLLFPLLLSAQCYGSFEAFAGAGFSNTPSTFSNSTITFDPAVVTRFGFGASFALSERLFLRTAVQFNQYGDAYDNSGLRWGTQHDGNGGFDPNTPSGEPIFLQTTRHQYIEGIIALRYDLRSRGKLRPFAEGGFALGAYGTSRINTLNGEGAVTERISTFRSVAPIARLGVGVNYQFNRLVSAYAMPVGQLHLQSVTAGDVVSTRPWQATLEVGIRVFVDAR